MKTSEQSEVATTETAVDETEKQVEIKPQNEISYNEYIAQLLESGVQIFDTVVKRGAFIGEEMLPVGTIRQKYVEQIQQLRANIS